MRTNGPVLFQETFSNNGYTYVLPDGSGVFVPPGGALFSFPLAFAYTGSLPPCDRFSCVNNDGSNRTTLFPAILLPSTWDLTLTLVSGEPSGSAGFTADSIFVQEKIFPLPGALPLFVSGLGVLGLLGWRRKRKGAAAVAA
jgi:hypothetical protein